MIEKSREMRYAGEANEGAGLRPCGSGGDKIRSEHHRNSHKRAKAKSNLPRRPNCYLSILPLPRASIAASIDDAIQFGSTKRVRCKRCRKSTLHRKNCFSIHCRAPEDLTNIYTSVTCTKCGLESSPCPNKDVHPSYENCLQWVLKDSEYSSAKVWELNCDYCRRIRTSCIRSKKNSQDRGENQLEKLTVKWTRCNHCFAIYKKGRGETGLHLRGSCRLLHTHPAAVESSEERFSRYTSTCEQMLSLNVFSNLPESLRKKIAAQCEKP